MGNESDWVFIRDFVGTSASPLALTHSGSLWVFVDTFNKFFESCVTIYKSILRTCCIYVYRSTKRALSSHALKSPMELVCCIKVVK